MKKQCSYINKSPTFLYFFTFSVLLLLLAQVNIFAQTEEDIAGFFSDGQKFYKEGKLSDAQIEFENILLIDNTNFEAKIWLAQVFADLKQIDKAKKLIQDAALQAPDHPRVKQLMKLIGVSSPKADKTDIVKDEALTLLGKNTSVRKYGIVIPTKKIFAGRHSDNLIDFDEKLAADEDKDKLEKDIDISKLQDKQGPLGDVFSTWEVKGIKAGLDKYFELLIANVKLLELSDNGLLVKGEKMFLDRLSTHPSDLEATYYLGVIYFLGGNMERAEKKLLPLRKDQQGHENILSTVFSKIDKWRVLENERILAFKKAEQERIAMELELKAKKEAEAQANNEKKDAWAEIDKNSKKNGGKISANTVEAALFHKQGYALYKKGRLDEAIVKYNKAIETNPNDAEFHFHLGLAWTDKGLAGDANAFGKAKSSFQQAISIAPGSKFAEDAKSMIGDIKSAEETMGN